ncbi:MAG: hypothetical protein WC277_09920 [Bacilli bacterium]
MIGNELIKLIIPRKITTWKQTHKTHKLIFTASEEIPTGKQTHKTHKTHKKSTVNKLIKLIKTPGKTQTHEFGNGGAAPDRVSGRLWQRLISRYEFYELPQALTCERKQYSIDRNIVHIRGSGKLIKLIELIRLMSPRPALSPRFRLRPHPGRISHPHPAQADRHVHHVLSGVL